MLSHSSWFSNSPVPRTCARPMQPLSGRPHSSWPSLATAGQPGFAPRGCSAAQEGPCPQTHVCMSRCSAHCTETMPSKGECSHTTPQVPSRPTTNCNSRQGEQASGSALHSSRLAPGQGPCIPPTSPTSPGWVSTPQQPLGSRPGPLYPSHLPHLSGRPFLQEHQSTSSLEKNTVAMV